MVKPVAMIAKITEAVGSFLSARLSFHSAEFLLNKWPNSGAIVFARSAIVTIQVYAFALLVNEAADPKSIWGTFSLAEVRPAVSRTLPWTGAIFAGAYVALYTRFASQWSYLTGLYNQIVQVQIQTPKGDDEGRSERSINIWWAAFVEDADDLHLATKPMFASVIAALLDDPDSRVIIIDTITGGARRVETLEPRVRYAYERAERKWRRFRSQAPPEIEATPPRPRVPRTRVTGRVNDYKRMRKASLQLPNASGAFAVTTPTIPRGGRRVLGRPKR